MNHQEQLFLIPPPPVIVAFGGGTDSVAMLIEMVRRKKRGETTYAHADLILFADTGGEKPYTYWYVKMFSDWLVANGFPPIVWVRAKNGLTLEQHSLNTGHMPSLAYRGTNRSCSARFKVTPQNQYVNQWEPARLAWHLKQKCVKLIGYEVNETRRSKNMEGRIDKKYDYQYPLMVWGWDRAKCVEVIEASGLPQPGKSACFFCPASKKCELDKMAVEHPDLFMRALAIEDNAQAKLYKIKGLGTSWRWRDYAEKNGLIPVIPVKTAA